MPSYHLPIYIKNATLEIRERVYAIQSGTASFADVQKFCAFFRIRCLANLFLSGVARDCVTDLRKSASAFAYFLDRSDQSDVLASLAAPLFDALVVNDRDVAARIARSLRQTWNQGREFEDDFLYVRFLIQRFFLDAPENELADLISRFEQIVDGEASPRLDICRSIKDNDSDAFETSLEALTDEWTGVQTRRIEAGLLLPEEASTTGRSFLEGLALVRLWESIGNHFDDLYEPFPAPLRTVRGPYADAAAFTAA
jgi:hypothetical protein